MTTFQWLTLILGLCIIVGVWFYNYWLERSFKASNGLLDLAGNYPDVLIDAPQKWVRHGQSFAGEHPETFIQPDIEPDTGLRDEWQETTPDHGVRLSVLDPDFYCIATLSLVQAVRADQMPSFQNHKHVQILGEWEGTWEALRLSDSSRTYTRLRIGLQLVDRQGAVDVEAYQRFCHEASHFALAYGGNAVFPDQKEIIQRAQQLDAVCIQVDKIVSLNVLASSAPFSIDQIRQLLEPAGMQLEGDGIFYARSTSGRSLFMLTSQDQTPLTHMQTVPAVTFLLDVPNVASGEQAFDQMADLAQHLALALGGDLVDDENQALKLADLEGIRQQLAWIYTQMDEHNMPAGSIISLRLFS